MALNFLLCDRDQELPLPPSLRDWLAEDHLVWFVLDAVDELDLGAFYAAYREDGWGRAAFEPVMMVALLLYAYAIGERSSRQIERRCREDVAFRVITANQVPDHATVAHQEVLLGTTGETLTIRHDSLIERRSCRALCTPSRRSPTYLADHGSRPGARHLGP